MKVQRSEHDACLRAAQEHRAKLSDGELVSLNIVAGAYACNEQVPHPAIEKALRIVDRLSDGAR